ncbi:MAG: hypothetical protein ING84_06345 [Cytophagales bacterium]|nr:hypothetical protein [Cytophagales bacterium]MCA6368149.1 hypothetical protein [Cytophagales bacterium]MCA6372040.1 hypothetical protein [Cytophagales bacterium]MCA6375782.1 hypothetical protein [Cytophagales bacterium]MCA6385648.1 hypothetical protein [Cytophagales bacterium]
MKVLKIAFVLIAIVVVVLAIFLFVDDPYPSYSTDGLKKVEWTQISSGKSIQKTFDSTLKNVSSIGSWFVDPTGRAMILHGINLGGVRNFHLNR